MNLNVYRTKATISKMISDLARYLFLAALGYVLLYPILFMVSKSVQAPTDVYNPMVQWIPRNFSLSGFKVAIEVLDIESSMVASLYYEIIAALLEIVSCAVAAYGLARFKFKGRSLLMGSVILNIFTLFYKEISDLFYLAKLKFYTHQQQLPSFSLPQTPSKLSLRI